MEGIRTIRIGDAAPEHKVKSTSGKDVAIGDYKGKKIVLFFYPKDNTSG